MAFSVPVSLLVVVAEGMCIDSFGQSAGSSLPCTTIVAFFGIKRKCVPRKPSVVGPQEWRASPFRALLSQRY